MSAAAVTVLAVPVGVSDSLRQDWRRMVGDPGQICFDHQRALLADPTGARLAAASASDADPDVVTIHYRAGLSDSATALADATATCVLHAGKVSEEQTARLREHMLAVQRFEKLTAEFACLDKKKALLRAGQGDQAQRLRCTK
ncbi:MAG: hypothetical protein AD742_11240 [Methylibium sp. NZG]|nr:MAG: hypothetical protein AD742_11240 [Methylibium sp. NZG]